MGVNISHSTSSNTSDCGDTIFVKDQGGGEGVDGKYEEARRVEKIYTQPSADREPSLLWDMVCGYYSEPLRDAIRISSLGKEQRFL